MSDFGNSRRNFLKNLTSTTVLSGPLLNTLAIPNGAVESMGKMDNRLGLYDGPESPLFNPVAIRGNKKFSEIADSIVSKKMADVVSYAPAGESTAWGIPFQIAEKIIFIKDTTVSIEVEHLKPVGLYSCIHPTSLIWRKTKTVFIKNPSGDSGNLMSILQIILLSTKTVQRYPQKFGSVTKSVCFRQGGVKIILNRRDFINLFRFALITNK